MEFSERFFIKFLYIKESHGSKKKEYLNIYLFLYFYIFLT